MSEAKSGNNVKVHYTGKLKDGTVFDSSKDRDPLEFKLGDGNMIPGFEKAITGMNTGDTVTAEIPADEAYGERRTDLVVEVPMEKVPNDITPEVGQKLTIKQPDGNQIPVVITETKSDSIVLDANHPLAGKDLVFEIELLDIK